MDSGAVAGSIDVLTRRSERATDGGCEITARQAITHTAGNDQSVLYY